MTKLTQLLSDHRRKCAHKKLTHELAKITERENHAKYDYEATVLWATHARDKARRDFEKEIEKLNSSTQSSTNTTRLNAFIKEQA